jgi:hypothetical protein
MLFVIFRILLTHVVACIATLVLLALPLVALAFVDTITASSQERNLSDLPALLANLAPCLPVALLYVLAFGAPWLPVLIMSRSASDEAKDWAVLLAPVPAAVVALGIELHQDHAHQNPNFEFGFLGLMVFAAPVAMILAALFLKFDRILTQALGERATSK